MLPSEFEALTADARRLGRLEAIEQLMGELAVSPGEAISDLQAQAVVKQVRYWSAAIRDRLAALTGGCDADEGQALAGEVVRQVAYPDEPSPPPPAVERIVASPRGEKLHAWCAERGLVGQALALAKSNFQRDLLADLTDDQVNRVWELLRPMRAVAAATMPPVPPPPRTPSPSAQVEKEGAVNENGYPIDPGWPRSGRMLYPWCKKMEDLYQTPFVAEIDSAYVKGCGWPRSYKDWDADMAEQAARYMIAVVRESPYYNGHADQYVDSYDAERDRLRSEVVRLATELLVRGGEPSPSWDAVRDQVARAAVSIDSDLYGEDMGDPSACDSVHALRKVAKVMESDLAQLASL